jgi:GNAT superfamily N-acetyltransferase
MSELKFVPLARDRPGGDVMVMMRAESDLLAMMRAESDALAMMRALYEEDPPSSPVDPARFAATVETLLAEPSRGSILLIEERSTTCGYAILIPYWSNEFGGTILYVDELFVVPQARNRGIAHQFFDFLAKTRPFDAVALALEVSPANERARRLYESVGFAPRRNVTLIRRLGG